MSFIKKNKILVAVLTFLFVILILIITYIQAYQKNTNKYGNRLNGIENVIINDNKFENIKQKLLINDICLKVSSRLDGKIIKFFIDVDAKTDELALESLFNSVLEEFTENEKGFYDFEIFVTSSAKAYPIIAYKHKNNDIFSISRKEVVENEE